eukprot:2836477-Prymnesium_polylepis.1
MAQNAEQTGAATLAELNAQGETIKRIQKDQARAPTRFRSPNTRAARRPRSRPVPSVRAHAPCRQAE